MKSQLTGIVAIILLALSIPVANSQVADKRVRSLRQMDENIIRSQVDDFEKAFAAGDAKTIALQWTPNGSFIDALGQKYIGRAEIEKLYASFFRERGVQPIAVDVESITFPGPNVAIEEGTTQLTKAGKAGTKGRYIAVHSKQNGRWLMDNVIETRFDEGAKPKAQMLKDLSWLVGIWTAKRLDASGNARTMKLEGSWIAGGKFLRLRYFPGTALLEDARAQQIDIVGFDPRLQRIVSWHFSDSGGFGYGQWNKSEDDWFINARGTEADGSVSYATYVLRRADDRHYTWQSTHRSLNSVKLLDTGRILVEKDAASK